MKTFRHLLMTVGLLLLVQCGLKKPKENLSGQILINHLGYNSHGIKRFVFQTKERHVPESFRFGLNPYNICMLDGRGRNNPKYVEGDKEMNVIGCVSNGITAGFGNEQDIAFYPDPYRNDPSHKWRWGEQWLQHGSWLMLAISLSLQ